MSVSLRRIIMNDVAGQGDEVRRAATLAKMREHRIQRVEGHGTAEGPEPVGEQMRVRQVQDPHRIS